MPTPSHLLFPLLPLLLMGGGGCTPEPVDSARPKDTADSGAPSDTGNSASHVDTGETGSSGALDISKLDPYEQGDVWVTPTDLEPGDTATVHYQGELAGVSSLILHYGLNGWNLDGGEDFVEEGGGGDDSWYRELGMEEAADGGFEVTLDLPEEAEALHFVFNEAGTDNWDNNGGRDYHASVRFPYIGPYLTWNDETSPTDGVVVSWETSVSCLGVVEYGESDAFGHHAVGTERDTLHHIALTDLEPATTYHYRVYDSTGQVSETHTFTTAKSETDTFSFVALSDMQDDGEDQRWEDVAQELQDSHADLAFFLVAGDMPMNDEPGAWWTFFRKGSTLLAERVLMPAPGNHDTPGTGHSTDTTSFERYYPLPGNATYYSFDYGIAHFLVLDSEDGSAFSPEDGEQYAFARSDLEACGEADEPLCERVFAAWHVPPYNAGKRHAEDQEDYRPLTALFDGAVDWVFSGHEHCYQRFAPIRYEGERAASESYGRGDSDGVGYMVLPPAGQYPADSIVAADDEDAWLRDLLAWPEPEEGVDKVNSEIGFVRVDLEGASLSLTTWGMGDIHTDKEPYVRDAISYEPTDP